MAHLSFLPVDFDDNISLLHRIRQRASHILLRSPSKPIPTTRRTRPLLIPTPTEDRSFTFTPYIPLANRHELKVRRVCSRSESLSSASSTELSYPTTPLNHVFPTTPITDNKDNNKDNNDDDHDDLVVDEDDEDIIRRSLLLPWLTTTKLPLHDDGVVVVDLPELDPSDAIPDSPTLPASLALPIPVPVLTLSPTSEPGTRSVPTLHIPPAPSYPPPTLASNSHPPPPFSSDIESKWDGETMVGDPETELDSPVDGHDSGDRASPDWTLHLTHPQPRSLQTKLVTSCHSNLNSPLTVYTDWTLELPDSRPPTPIPTTCTVNTQTRSAVPPVPPLPARVSQCPSSWLSPYPHSSAPPPPPPLRKAKSAHSLLPLSGPLPRPLQSYPQFNRSS